MLNEPLLKDVLIALAEQSGHHSLVVSGLIDEIAALREAVSGLDPTFADVLELKRKENASDQVRKGLSVLNDEIVQRLKDGLVI